MIIGKNTKAQIDSIAITNTIKHRPFLALSEILTNNFLVNRYSAWGRDLEWAKVTPKDWLENIKIGLKSDSDGFDTNFFGHPYQGSTYYNAARSSGYTYWQSIPFTVGGSLMWEFLAETEPASEIDLNTTSYGGIYLGELTHRLSMHFLTSDKKRKYRTARHIAAWLVNPVGLLNANLHDDVMRNFTRADENDFKLNTSVSFGGAYKLLANGPNLSNFHFNYLMIHGSLFNRGNYKPFDFFILRSWLDIKSNTREVPLYFNVSSHAPIWKKDLNHYSILAISQHFDFMHNPSFKLGAMSLTMDYYAKISLTSKSFYIGSVKAGVVTIGSSNSEAAEYFNNLKEIPSKRNYVYGRGFAIESEMVLKTEYFGDITASYNNWIMYTKQDIRGLEISNIVRLDYYYPIHKKLRLGMEYYAYWRRAKYYDYQQFSNIKKSSYEAKLLVNIII